MNVIERQELPSLAASGKIALLVIVSIILWTIGAPALLKHANAADLTSVSDTLSNSGPSQAVEHTIQYTNSTSTIAGQTIQVTIDPDTSLFTEAYSTASSSDIYLLDNGTALTQLSTCGTNGYTLTPNYNTGSNEGLTFTLCPSTSISAGDTVTIVVGSSTPLWTNPATTNSYRIVVGGTQDNSGQTRVAVLPNVTLTAAVSTSFTFTVGGVATDTEIGAGDFTTGSSTPTSLPFGTLSSSPNASSSLAQTLSVATNASNGFSVTVQEDQPPTSASGQVIYLFKDGASTTVPVSWAAPSSTIGVYDTYGHFGVTSDDSNLTGADNQFANGTKWAGDLYHARVVFANNGPADGSTQNVGYATVGYKIQIGPLQAAGNDYTNTLRYVATPTF